MSKRVPTQTSTNSYYTARDISIWLKFTRNRAEPFYAQLYNRVVKDEQITVVLYGVHRYGRNLIVKHTFTGAYQRRDAQEFLTRLGFTPFEE